MSTDQTEKETIEAYLAQRKQLEQWIRHHPMFAHEIRRIKKTIDKKMEERDDMLVMYRQTHKDHYKEKARILLLHAQNHIKTFSKLELLATLSKR